MPSGSTRSLWALRAALLAAFVAILVVGTPAHLSVDSVMALYEGRHQVRETFGPVVYARILGVLDRVVPGVALYGALSLLTLFGALMTLPGLRGRASWWAAALVVVLAASPTLVLFQGIVWKDVLFANFVVAGFVCVAHAVLGWSRVRRRWLQLLVSAVLFALAMSIRQNGLVMVVGAAASLGLAIQPARGVRTAWAWGLGWLAMVILLAGLAGHLAHPRAAGADKAFATGLRILQHYDVVAVAARDPATDLAVIAAARPQAATLIKAQAASVYSPERIDFFDRSQELGPALWKTPASVMRAQWLEVVQHQTGAYLAHRWDAFVWVFFTPEPERCLPIFVGVTGPAEKLAGLDLAARLSPKDLALGRYARAYLGTPAYSHAFFAILALIVAALLLVRREPPDVVVAGLLLSSLAFAASFFAISIACDYRYLYALDLAAVVGALYLALDPPRFGAPGGAKT